MTQPYCFDIETLLNAAQPDSILVLGDGADTAIESYLAHKRLLGKDCRVHRATAQSLDDAAGRCDMGIVTDTLEYLAKRAAIRLLSRLRDLYTARFCAAVRMGEDWPELQSTWTRNELLGIGMMLVNSYEQEPDRRIQLYKYDIATYKATPRWLTPDNWANPELWDKYRW